MTLFIFCAFFAAAMFGAGFMALEPLPAFLWAAASGVVGAIFWRCARGKDE